MVCLIRFRQPIYKFYLTLLEPSNDTLGVVNSFTMLETAKKTLSSFCPLEICCKHYKSCFSCPVSGHSYHPHLLIINAMYSVGTNVHTPWTKQNHHCDWKVHATCTYKGTIIDHLELKFVRD